MPDSASPPVPPASGASAALQVPTETLQKFGDIVQLIKESESMNTEERQYWINILPVMTPDQLQSLRDILANEKKQLQAIDEKYAKEIQKVGVADAVAKTDDDRKKKREDRRASEATHKQEEEKALGDILQSIEQLGTDQH